MESGTAVNGTGTDPGKLDDQVEPGSSPQRLERLLDISRALTNALELEPFLHSIISTAAELTGCEQASILTLDEDGEQLHFLVMPGFHQDKSRSARVPLPSEVAGWVIKNGLPAVSPDGSAEPLQIDAVDSMTDFTAVSLIAVPIIFRGETLGALEVVNRTRHAHYTGEDLGILETLASQAALALVNARLLDKVQFFQEQKDQLDRMKSDFIGIASHELRTPLGLVLGHAIFLRETILPEFQPQLDVIVRNAMRLKQIVDDVANMDNVQRGVASVRSHSISIKHLIEKVIDSFQPEVIQKPLSLRAETGDQDLFVEGDAVKLGIALSNMVKNAITFTNPGGHILVLAELIPGFVKVSVIDDGIGIPTRDLSHIFERFYQVESHLTRKHGGMGLGLSVSKVMIELHGGRIWVESVEGKGSNFTFLLPVKTGLPSAANRDRSS